MDRVQIEAILTSFYTLAPMAVASETSGDVLLLLASLTEAQKILVARAVLAAVSPAMRSIVDTVAIEVAATMADANDKQAFAPIGGRYIVQREKMLDYASRALLKALRLYRDRSAQEMASYEYVLMIGS